MWTFSLQGGGGGSYDSSDPPGYGPVKTVNAEAVVLFFVWATLGNEVIVDHWKWTKMLTKVFERNLTPGGYVKPLIKPHPNPPWGKPRFR